MSRSQPRAGLVCCWTQERAPCHAAASSWGMGQHGALAGDPPSSQKAPVSLLRWQKITNRGDLGSVDELLKCQPRGHPGHPPLQSWG